MERKSIGQFIAALRKANGLTQKQLADQLNVSDKAVSRWERDETAPDISLIPVIADIFGVTCDELLCGERKINNDTTSANDEVLSAKGEKQRRRLLAIGLSQFKNKSLISCSVAAVGLIAALICNFAFYRAYLGFFIAILFYLAALVCQIIFVNKVFVSVADDEYSDTEILDFKRSAVRVAEFAISAIFVLAVITLPLVANPVSSPYMDAYSGILPITWLSYGALYGIIGFVICLLVSHKINSSLANKGIINESNNDKRRRQNFYLGFLCAVFFIVMAGITLFMWFGITEDGYAPKFAKGTVFNDYESFAEFMEKDVPDPNPDIEAFYPDDYNYYELDEYGNTYLDSITEEIDGDDDEFDEYYDPYEGLFISDSDYGFVNGEARIVIKAANGEILLDCEKNNHSVVYMQCGDESDGWLPIRVVTYDDLPEAEHKLAMSGYATIAIIALEAGVAIFIYFKKREKISK